MKSLAHIGLYYLEFIHTHALLSKLNPLTPTVAIEYSYKASCSRPS